VSASFLGRHRTICAVLTEIQELARKENPSPLEINNISVLCDEALMYARAMSNKLTEYKAAKNEP
jgi:hypothetical protein